MNSIFRSLLLTVIYFLLLIVMKIAVGFENMVTFGIAITCAYVSDLYKENTPQ